MLSKFAAGTIVSSFLIALGGTVVLAVRLLTGQKFYSVAALWCLVPFIWGVWMVLTPPSSIERRLPAWGAILGVLAAVGGIYILDVPQRVAGLYLPNSLKPLFVFVAAGMYAAVWIVVGKIYKALEPSPQCLEAK